MSHDPPGPYGTEPYGAEPYGTGPYGTEPYGTKPYGAAPYGAGPPGHAPYGTGSYGAPVPPAYSPYPTPPNNGFAIAALVTGIAGFCCLLAPVAIGLGIAGLSVARRTGVGRVMSMAGMALGIAWLLIFALLAVVIWQSLPSTF